MEGDVQDEERLRWRPWPCRACGGVVAAVDYLDQRFGAGEAIPQGNVDQVIRDQIDCLCRWIDVCPHASAQTISLPKLDEGSEHLVYLDAPNANVLKVTRPGLYGEHYYLVEGMVHQQNSSPLEYLQRMEFWDELFGWAPKPLGLTGQGRVVSRQRFIQGTLPTQEEVDEFLIAAG